MVAGSASPDTEATVLIHNGRRYAEGIKGDLVLVGDWDCDDVATPAIVRPSTGEVVMFERWPAAGESISAPANWHVDHTLDAEIDRSGPCDRLRVNTATGSQLIDPGIPS